MVSTETTSLYTEILVFLEEELQVHGVCCMMVHFLRESASIRQKISLLRGIFDGIILISSNVSAEDLLKRAATSRSC